MWCLISVPPVCCVCLSSVIPGILLLLYCCVIQIANRHLAIFRIMSFSSASVAYVHSLLALVLGLSFSLVTLLLLLLPPFPMCPFRCPLRILPLYFPLLIPLYPLSFAMSFAFFSFGPLSVAFSSTVAFQKSRDVWDQASALRASFVAFSFCRRDSFAVARVACILLDAVVAL